MRAETDFNYTGVTARIGNFSTLAAVQHDRTQAVTESAIAQHDGVSERPSGFNRIKALQTRAVHKSPNPEWTPGCRIGLFGGTRIMASAFSDYPYLTYDQMALGDTEIDLFASKSSMNADQRS